MLVKMPERLSAVNYFTGEERHNLSHQEVCKALKISQDTLEEAFNKPIPSLFSGWIFKEYVGEYSPDQYSWKSLLDAYEILRGPICLYMKGTLFFIKNISVIRNTVLPDGESHNYVNLLMTRRYIIGNGKGLIYYAHDTAKTLMKLRRDFNVSETNVMIINM